MRWILVILAVNCCLRRYCFVEAKIPDDSDSGHDDSESAEYRNTRFDDVRCTTIDDVIAVRRNLCPTGCSCWPLSGQDVWTTLNVNCSRSRKFNSSRLNQLLTQCTGQLQALTITNTPLDTPPQAVCLLFNLQSLNLNNNRLASLPSNCFTRMRNLTSFTASSNRLTSLQVSLRQPISRSSKLCNAVGLHEHYTILKYYMRAVISAASGIRINLIAAA